MFAHVFFGEPINAEHRADQGRNQFAVRLTIGDQIARLINEPTHCTALRHPDAADSLGGITVQGSRLRLETWELVQKVTYIFQLKKSMGWQQSRISEAG